MTDMDQPSAADIARQWWQDLTLTDPGRRGAQRAARARLRRAATVLDVIQEREALRLVARLPGRSPERVATLAGVLAFVGRDAPDGQNVARAIGRNSLDDVDSALMSEGRFRRLLQADDDDLMDAMRRLVRLTKGVANVRDLSFAVLYWGDGVKKRWIFDYYNVPYSTRPHAGAPDSPLTSPSA